MEEERKEINTRRGDIKTDRQTKRKKRERIYESMEDKNLQN